MARRVQNTAKCQLVKERKKSGWDSAPVNTALLCVSYSMELRTWGSGSSGCWEVSLLLWAPERDRTQGRTEGVGGEKGWSGVFISLSWPSRPFIFLTEATGIEVLIGLGTWVPLFVWRKLSALGPWYWTLSS